MLTYKIHLIRHGLTKANYERRYIGATDLPLCSAGIEQLKTLCDTFEYPQVQAVYTSPLLRAVQTAQILFPGCSVQKHEDLRELNFGAFENRTIEDLEQDDAFRAWIAAPDRAAPGGESGSAAADRAALGLTAVFAQMMQQKIFSAAVVTHGGIMASILCRMGLPQRDAMRWQCGPGEGYTLLLTPQMWMRDQKFEVYSRLPVSLEEPEPEEIWQELAREDVQE